MWRRARLHNYAGPLYKRIFMLIEAYIKQGLLVADERLPSERRLAQLLEVDRSTVVHALDELCEHGILRRKLGSGTYINQQKVPLLTSPMINRRPPMRLLANKSQYHQKMVEVRRQAIQSKSAYSDLANGDLPIELLPQLTLPAMTQQELIQQERALDANLYGLSTLKQQIIHYMHYHFAMKVNMNDILITSGTQQSLFLISQGLLKSGDTIGVESSSYFYSLPLFRSVGLRLTPIACDQQGITISGLALACARQRIKWIFINPIFQNPTGKIMGTTRKKQILAYCQQQHIHIVEDDACSALYFHHDLDRSPLKKYDCNQQVIYLGSLSKYIGHHIRIGWIIAPAAVVQQLAEIRQFIDAGLSILPQLLAENYLAYHFQSHQAMLRLTLAKRQQQLHQFLNFFYPEHFSYQLALGGLHLYLRFKQTNRYKQQNFLNQWLLKNIFVMEGSQFGDSADYLRLSYGHFNKNLFL